YYLAYGSIRIKKKGSSGGHNGLKSIEVILGNAYLRIRAGIRNEIEKAPMIKFVLNEFNQNEKKSLGEFTKILSEAALAVVTLGPDEAMNRYNRVVT
ncbi:MAG: aminoacyl-tRNA hydrolase, partial [Alphaproteobacteria bacterium]|nr:aminoacyl-tRNA hydrolase [Alphaproteobacteria bacterium]